MALLHNKTILGGVDRCASCRQCTKNKGNGHQKLGCAVFDSEKKYCVLCAWDQSVPS
tara:strand:+ start:502 stop:672 length:171 start_codon:yes stop_codon:yes gene_type:complete